MPKEIICATEGGSGEWPDPHAPHAHTMSLDHRHFPTLAAVCLAALMFGLEISSVPIILPVLQDRLQADFDAMQWIMNAYTIACTSVLMATGALADRYGRRRVFAVSVVAFGLTSLLCGLAPGVGVLIAARFLQGLAGGAMFICSIAILSHRFPGGRERASAFAVWGVVAGIGLGFGPVIGGAFVALTSWHWVFAAHAPLSLASLAIIVRGVAESSDPQARERALDWGGIVTLTAAVLGTTVLITEGTGLGWHSPVVMALAAASALALGGFICIERAHPHPMFDFSVFRIRDFSGAILGCIGMNCSYWPFMIYLPLYFSAGLGLDIRSSSQALLAYTVPFLVMPPIAQRLLLRHDARVVIPAGLVGIGLGFMLMSLGRHFAWLGMGSVLPGAFVAGLGLGLTTTPASSMVTAAVPADRAGMASGMDVSARLITLALNIAVMGFVLTAGLRDALEGTASAPELDILVERLASGDADGARRLLAASIPADRAASLVQTALSQGFGWVMLYGGLAAWLAAAASWMAFGAAPDRAAPQEGCTVS
jgi:EmrB/QacA subfamily drug resistance transporter